MPFPTTTSKVPAVTAFLLELFRRSLPEVQVSDGTPGATLEAETIVIADVTFSQEWAAIGAKNRDENAEIRVVVYVRKMGGTQTEANERAFELLAACELALRSDPTLGGLVLQLGVVPVAHHKSMGDAAREAYIAVDLKYRARI